MDMGCDVAAGVVLGVLLTLIAQDVKKYGIKRMLFFPERLEVRQVFEYI